MYRLHALYFGVVFVWSVFESPVWTAMKSAGKRLFCALRYQCTIHTSDCNDARAAALRSAFSVYVVNALQGSVLSIRYERSARMHVYTHR
jgi:hypothetical protein